MFGPRRGWWRVGVVEGADGRAVTGLSGTQVARHRAGAAGVVSSELELPALSGDFAA